MTDNKNIKGLVNLLKEFSDSVCSSKESAAEYLAEQGKDPEKLVKEGCNEIKLHLFISTANRNQQQGVSLMEKAVDRIKEFLNENLDKPKHELLDLLKVKAPAVKFRNLDKLEDEDIREILMDVDLDEFLEKFSK